MSAFFQSFSPLFLALTHLVCSGPLLMTLAPTPLLTDLPRLLPGTPRADGKEDSLGHDHAGSDGRRRFAPASNPLQVTSAGRAEPIATHADFSADRGHPDGKPPGGAGGPATPARYAGGAVGCGRAGEP